MPGRSFISREDLALAAHALAAGLGQTRAAAELGWDMNKIRRCVTRLETEVRLEGQRMCSETSETALEWLRMRELCTPGELERAVAMIRQDVLASRESTLKSGMWLRDTGDHAAAETMYRRHLLDDPGCIEIVDALGGCLLEMERPEEALECFDEALSRSPGDARILYGRATALYRLGREEEAVADLEVAYRRAPDDESILVSLGSWRMGMNRDKAENVEILKQAMSILWRKYANRSEGTEYCRYVSEMAFLALWGHGYAEEALAVARTAEAHGWRTSEMVRAIKKGAQARAPSLALFHVSVRARAEMKPPHWPDNAIGYDIQFSAAAHSADDAKAQVLKLVTPTESPSVRWSAAVHQTPVHLPGSEPWSAGGSREWIFAAVRAADASSADSATVRAPSPEDSLASRRTRPRQPARSRRRPGGSYR